MKVALSEGRLSQWEDLLDELDMQQVQVLRALNYIEPFGDSRADMRAAVMTSILAAGQCGAEIDPNKLKDYLGSEKDQEEIQSPNAAAATMRGVLPGK